MPVQLKVTSDDREVRGLLKTALRQTGDLTRPMQEMGLWLVRDGVRRLRARSAKSDDHTGALEAELHSTADRVSTTVASNLPYAAVQQLGHPGIAAKPPLKRIAIPLLPHLRRRGIWPRDLPKDTLRMGPLSKRGNPLLLGPAGGEDKKASRWIPWYVLVKQAVIKVEPYLVFGKQAAEFLKRRLIKWIGLKET